MNLIKSLELIPLFEGLPERQLSDLATIALEKSFKKGVSIFSEGDPGNGFYVVKEGRIKIYKISSEGKEQILHVFGSGEPFGEAPVFEGRRFPAHAEALMDTICIFFPRKSFTELISKNPSLAMNMLGVLSRRLRRFAALVEDLSLKEVPGRLAAYLLYLSETESNPTELSLDMAKGQLAGMLGTIPETLSRILGKLAKQGFIEAAGPKIKIMNRKGLEELADGSKRL
ncbi:MAG: Crp/Fnr family transcriptional regulator [Deltaproteobacteria bacterium]|nr:Crp/Fnr family transcriptional regulator [Deltaproteobacteria bacterium]